LLNLEDIYDEHVWRVYAFFAYRLGTREDAEDLTQATFERAMGALRRYDSSKGTPLTWLMAIAHNLLIDYFRRQAGRRTRPLDDEVLDGDSALAAPIDEVSLGLDPDLAAALELLTERERELVALRYGADLSGPEIAALKGLSLANVQQILSRSLRRMRAALEERQGVVSERR
jgi:RNA polymerase sigma factor (sigma-70 family)